MNGIEDFCKNLKKDFTPKIKNSRKPVKYWSEIDIIEDKPVNTYVIIFRTKGWLMTRKECSMCHCEVRRRRLWRAKRGHLTLTISNFRDHHEASGHS